MQDYPLILDTALSDVQQTVTGFYCGDAREKRLCITLFHHGVAYVPQPGALAICGKKPDGTRFLHPCTVSDSQIYYTPTAQTLAVPGMVECQLIVYGTNGSVLFAPRFAIDVEQPLQPQEGLVSADEWTLLPVELLAGLAKTEDDKLLFNHVLVGSITIADSFSDLEDGVVGQLAIVRSADAAHASGVYFFDTEWTFLPMIEHSHTNKAVLDAVTTDVVDHVHTHANKTVLDSVTTDVVDHEHSHANLTALNKIDESASGEPRYNSMQLKTETPDTLVPLALGTEYASLSVRDDWQDVPVYNLGDNPVVCRLASDDTVGAFAASEIRLMYLTDYITGMPVPALRVTTGGDWYICYADTFHDLGQTYAAGWYDAEGNALESAPTLTNMTFDSLIVSNDDPITDLTDLSGEALAALETLSRMVNVSTDAMGTLGVVENGVQRLTNAPQTSGQHYAFTTDRNITFPLPTIHWTGKTQAFWLDLDCTSSINLTFSGTVKYADGNNVDTTRGKHRLHFYVFDEDDQWTVAETESYTEFTEDYLPEYTIPFRNCTADQIRAVLKLGYSDGNGNWCLRRKNGSIQTWFSVGDTHSVTLKDGREVTMRIIDISYDDMPNGGKAPLSCDFVELLSVDTYRNYTRDRYDASSSRIVARSVVDLFPDWLSGLCVAAHKVCSYLTGGDEYDSTWSYVDDKTWLLGMGEVGFRNFENEPCYAIFTDNQSRIRYDINGERNEWTLRIGRDWWTVNAVNPNGGASQVSDTTDISCIAIGFCLNA